MKVVGRWMYLYRAVDQYGQVIDVLISPKRDVAATRRFFIRALGHARCPTEVATDQAPTYPRVIEKLIPAACHVAEQSASLSLISHRPCPRGSGYLSQAIPSLLRSNSGR